MVWNKREGQSRGIVGSTCACDTLELLSQGCRFEFSLRHALITFLVHFIVCFLLSKNLNSLNQAKYN